MPDGTAVECITICSGDLSAEILTYGATIRSLVFRGVDVVLGYDDLGSYRTRSGRLGATIGRFANRIGDARFTLDGVEHHLTVNRGQDHIHGGNVGFDKKVWDVVRRSEDSVTLHVHADDGEEGYPGAIDVELTFSIRGDALVLEYLAHSDADTICNLTNHSYFNLGGSGTIEDHEVSLAASCHTEFNERGIPTGQVIPIGNSRLDLRSPVIMGNMLFYGGYDNNYLLDRGEEFARVYCGRTGITMVASTDMPAVQFYTANGLKDVPGKNGQIYGKHSGLCLETQFCPDAPNHENFASCVLRKGEEYRHVTTYQFH